MGMHVLALYDFCPRTYHSQILGDRGLKHCYPPKKHTKVLSDVKKKKFFLLYFLFFFWKSIFSHCCSRSCFNLKTSNGCGFADAAHFHVSAVDISVLKLYLSWNSDSYIAELTCNIPYRIQHSLISPSFCRSNSTKHTDSNDIWKSTTNTGCDTLSYYSALQSLLCTTSLYIYTFL